ncbi:putative glucarate transporter [Planctomycetes bacterium Pan216]|uniref:Lysosomal dipeptide transporter MFSD1 n=1 Tax=Kolteria novifilia TaxID=2527975 RepID=A0A518B403_9BACT|nr:putative glucarate transporter [Planctomycetes bacterium Pan216]
MNEPIPHPSHADHSSQRKSYFLLYSWLVFLVAICFNAYDAYLRVTPSVTSASLRTDLGISEQGLGALMTFYFVPFVLLQIPVGLLIDRMGPRRLLALAVLLSATGSFLFGAATNLSMAYSARILIGVGGAFPGVGPIYLASRWFPARYIGALAGLTGTSTVVGSVGGQALLGFLLDSMTWRAASYVAAGLGLLLSLLIFVLVRDNPPEGHPLHRAKSDDGADRQTFAEAMHHLKGILSRPDNWLNGIWGSLTLMPMLAFASLWAVPYLISVYKVSDAVAATAASTAFIGLAFGGPTAGLLSDSVKSRRIPMIVFASAALVDILVIVYVPGIPFEATYPLLFLLGFCLGSQGSLVFAVALEINPPSSSGVAIGFTQALSNLGGAVFPPVIGQLLYLAGGPIAEGETTAHSVGDFKFALAVIPAGLVVAIIAALILRESYGMRIAEVQESPEGE